MDGKISLRFCKNMWPCATKKLQVMLVATFPYPIKEIAVYVPKRRFLAATIESIAHVGDSNEGQTALTKNTKYFSDGSQRIGQMLDHMAAYYKILALITNPAQAVSVQV